MRSLLLSLLTALTLPLALAPIGMPSAAAYEGDKYWTEYAKLAEDPAIKKTTARIETTYEEPGRQARSKGDLHQAAALWEKALAEWKAQPDSVYRTTKMRTAMDNCLGIYRAQNRDDKIELTYHQMAALYHDYHVASLSESLAEILIKQKKYKEAESFLTGLIKDDRTDKYPHDRIWLAKVYDREKDPGLAEKTLNDLERSAQLAKRPLDVRSARVAYLDFLTAHNRKADAAKVQQALNDKHCPICGSEQEVQPIAYGLIRNPPPNVHLGGCMVGPDSPRWYCQKDKLEF